MKSFLILISLLVSSSVFASQSAEYKCNSATDRGVLRVVDTKYAEPRVDFYPKGDHDSDSARKRYSAYFSDLQNNKGSNADYLVHNETDYLILVRIYTSLQMDSSVLRNGRTVRVVLTKRTQSALGKKLLSLDVKSYVCHLNNY